MALTVTLGGPCAQCLRLTGEIHRMEVHATCYLCPNCKAVHPTRQERGRRGLISELRTGGFFLLLLASLVYSTLGIQSELVWMGFLAGYSYYFLTIFQNTRSALLHV